MTAMPASAMPAAAGPGPFAPPAAVRVPTSGLACTQADTCAIEDDLGWALGTVFRAYVKLATVALADLPGGPRSYQVLAAASRAEQGTQLALAQQLGVDRTVMTYLLDDLERADLVTRQPDPADRRARRVVVTATGRALLAHLDQRLHEAEEHVLAALDKPERAAFRSLLRRVALRAGTPDPIPGTPDPIHSACDVVEEIAGQRQPRQPTSTGSPRRTRRR